MNNDITVDGKRERESTIIH